MGHGARLRMNQLTHFFVAMLGLAALASAQARHEGSPTCRVRNATAAPVAHRSVAAVSRHPARVVSRGPAYRLRSNGRARSRCGTTRGGFYRTIQYQVWVPGYYLTESVPPRYGWVHGRCGASHWGLVEAAYTRRVYVPGRYETQSRRVWQYR